MKTASDFIGSAVGESAKRTSDIIANAAGKVLVIDEAYNLSASSSESKHANAYGKQVLDTIVEKIQGTPNDDIVVLLLGYESEMMEMIRTGNPGLKRRFSVEHAFYFPDYTDHELVLIFMEECRKQNIQISSYKVAQLAIKVLAKQRLTPNFGNVGNLKTLLQAGNTKSFISSYCTCISTTNFF